MKSTSNLLRAAASAACVAVAGCVTAPSMPSPSSPSSAPPSQSSSSSSSSSSGSQSQSQGSQGSSQSSGQQQSAGTRQGSGQQNGGSASQNQGQTTQSQNGQSARNGDNGAQQASNGAESQGGTASAPGQRSEDQVLSEAMEVFDRDMGKNQGEAGQSPSTDGQTQADRNGGGANGANTATGASGDAGQGNGNMNQSAQNGTPAGSGGNAKTQAAQQQASAAGAYGTGENGEAENGGGRTGTGAGDTAAGGYGPAGAGSGAYGGGDSGTAGGGASTDAEKRAALDHKLDRQMAVFDGMILQRRADVIEQENREGGSSGQHTYGSGGGAGAYPGDEAGEAPPLLTATAEDTTGNVRTRGQVPDAEAANRQGDYKQGQGEAKRDDRIPDDIPSGNDDDIVARQLREAAMNEDDPELRAKLWDEYRKYKQGVQAKK